MNELNDRYNRAFADEAFTRWYFAHSPESRILGHIEHMMCSLRDLPEFACTESPLVADADTFPAVFGCREAFYVHVRAAAEFFWKMPNQDFTARTFMPDWSLDDVTAAEMKRLWNLTSRHVVHMSRMRTPSEFVASEDTTFLGLRSMGRHCWDALDQFADAYTSIGGEYAREFERVRDISRPPTDESLPDSVPVAVQSERWALIAKRFFGHQ